MQTTTATQTEPVTQADAQPTMSQASTQADERTRRRVWKTITSRSFCTLATSSEADSGHCAGVVYVYADGALWVHTLRGSRKARNVAVHDRVGICIPFRRLPVGPPYTIHFQAQARLVAMDDPAVRGLVEDGSLKAITGHGELEMADGCFLRIEPAGTVHSFGPGARMIDLIRDPLTSGARSFRLDTPT